ncbi:hypothetical protein CONCODRAFT_2544 [Conidiobolus coronatus NRRL 28638]|uniref:AA1-like domain-containing protein n=1 Tax=Conidiobolus coronatus (strain ATCC 28846 / CBS 209.66 / NRRL 28638) TaxID=796925 RepID=A0A137PH57_CONC2|nr:hypothetical protein CONCODRAFT_2544 [Conidiobolus coronatus NRRL 28638]|eukprot:KXN74339.1 hypothetical protein CONCODRAFT_2544 [Conidiobolus coronatus NRRL 28638]
MKFVSLLAFATAVACSGKNIRITSFRSGTAVGASSSCSVKISNRNTGENLDLNCSMYGFGQIACNTESRDSSFGNYDARIMDCGNDGYNMYTKVAVWDKIGKYMAIKTFNSRSSPSCGHSNENRSCQTNWLIDEYWSEA